MVTQAVVTDMPDLYEGRTGRTCMRQLLDFYKFATDHTASRPDFWSFYAHLQDGSGTEGLWTGLGDESLDRPRRTPPATTRGRWRDLMECFDLIDNTLDDPATKEISKSHVAPFGYLLLDAAKKLQEKLAATVQEPPWKPAVAQLQTLAQKANERR
eukprot:g26297.t1